MIDLYMATTIIGLPCLLAHIFTTEVNNCDRVATRTKTAVLLIKLNQILQNDIYRFWRWKNFVKTNSTYQFFLIIIIIIHKVDMH